MIRTARSGLFRKFIVVMGALAVAPVAFLGIQLVAMSRRGIQSAELELHTKLAEKTAQQVDDYFKASDEEISFALALSRKRLDLEAKRELLGSLVEAHPDIIEVSLLDARGGVLLNVRNPRLADEAAPPSRAVEEETRRLLREPGRAMALSRSISAPSLILYYPMGPMSRLARVALSLRSLAAVVAGERIGETGFAVLVDSRGQPLLYPKDRLTGSALRDFPRWPITALVLKSRSGATAEFSDASGRAYLGAYARMATVGGAVVILQSRDEAYLPASRMKSAAAGLTLLVALLCVFLTITLAQRLTQPLLSLTTAAEAVARGDFQARVDISTGDELQDLADTFNRMTAHMRAYSLLHVDRLIAEQRKTEAILFSITDGILMVDKQGKIQLANRKALEMLGLEPQTPVDGKTIREALPDSPLREAILEVSESPGPEKFKDVDLTTQRVRRHLRVTATPVVTPGGVTLGVVTALLDVTLLRELDLMKDEFLHYVTHDLRNPLSSALGFVEILLKGTVGVLNPEQKGVVLSIKRAATRLMNLINNILDIAKMESGRIRLELRTVSLAGLASRSISILESLALLKDIRIHLDASEEFSIELDPDLIERVFVNLIGNAIKYTPDGGAITVSIRDEGKSIKVCVGDTGEGIPPEYRQRIFGKFEQVGGQRRGGTGLGLTITKFFLEAHLGSIWVDSEIGKGSRFYFTVPKGLRVSRDGKVSVEEQRVA